MKTGQKPCKGLDILKCIPLYMLAVFIFFVLITSLIKRAEFCGYRYGDRPMWVRQDTIMLLLSVLLLLFAFFLILWLGKRLERYKRGRVIFTILVLSVATQVGFILLFPANQFADQKIVNEISLDIISGEYKDFRDRGYLCQFPNNVGITLFLSMVYRLLPDSLFVPRIINVLSSTLTAFLIFRIFEETTGTRENKGYGILVLAGFFPPAVLLNNLVYNDIIVTTVFTGVVYCAVRFIKTKNWRYPAISGVLVVIGNFLRPLGLILLIAITLYFVVKRIGTARSTAYFTVIFIMCGLPMAAVNSYFLHTGKITEPIDRNSIPIHMWLNIGMNEKKIGYWDDSMSYDIYIKKADYSRDDSRELYRKIIENRVKTSGILGIAKVYVEKNLWLWSEGTYQAEYYGIGSWGYLYPTFATGLFDGNMPLRDKARWVLHTLNITLLLLSFISLARAIPARGDYPMLLPAIVVLGFIGFYTLWEIKPRYIYSVYPCLILMAYHGLGFLFPHEGVEKQFHF